MDAGWINSINRGWNATGRASILARSLNLWVITPKGLAIEKRPYN
jgi:hypothetical protein